MHALNFNPKLEVLNAKQMLVLSQLPKVNIYYIGCFTFIILCENLLIFHLEDILCEKLFSSGQLEK